MTRLFRCSLLVIAAFACCAMFAAARADESGKEGRLFEMRTYITNDGKLPDLHKRFSDHTIKLFEKHGMTIVGFWTPVDGPDADNTLVYMLAYPDLEGRKKSWAAFISDPDWMAVYKASRANGPLVKKVISQYVAPTDYSPIK
jgi:hypothetical protein